MIDLYFTDNVYVYLQASYRQCSVDVRLLLPGQVYAGGNLLLHGTA